MPHKKRARDLMVPLEKLLRPQTPLREAVRLMRATRRSDQQYGVKGLPVVDENGQLVGMLTLKEIKKALFPYYMEVMDFGELTWDGMFEMMTKRLKDKSVADVMNTELHAVSEDAPLMECFEHMMKQDVTRLPVIDAYGKVVGMVYEIDLFRIFMDILLAKDDLNDDNGDDDNGGGEAKP